MKEWTKKKESESKKTHKTHLSTKQNQSTNIKKASHKQLKDSIKTLAFAEHLHQDQEPKPQCNQPQQEPQCNQQGPKHQYNHKEQGHQCNQHHSQDKHLSHVQCQKHQQLLNVLRQQADQPQELHKPLQLQLVHLYAQDKHLQNNNQSSQDSLNEDTKKLVRSPLRLVFI